MPCGLYRRAQISLKSHLAAAALALFVAACSNVSEDNFARIEEGMSQREVIAILGAPTESNSVFVLGLSGATSRWVGRNTVIAVHFVNGKVALKTLEKPASGG
jgi:hypothetical protein